MAKTVIRFMPKVSNNDIRMSSSSRLPGGGASLAREFAGAIDCRDSACRPQRLPGGRPFAVVRQWRT